MLPLSYPPLLFHSSTLPKKEVKNQTKSSQNKTHSFLSLSLSVCLFLSLSLVPKAPFAARRIGELRAVDISYQYPLSDNGWPLKDLIITFV